MKRSSSFSKFIQTLFLASAFTLPLEGNSSAGIIGADQVVQPATHAAESKGSDKQQKKYKRRDVPAQTSKTPAHHDADWKQMQATFQRMREFLAHVQDFDTVTPSTIAWLRKIQQSANAKAYILKIKFLPSIVKDSIRITTYPRTHELQVEGCFREESIQKDVLGKVVNRRIEDGKFIKKFSIPYDADFTKMETFYKDQEYTLKLYIPRKTQS